jgi:hypothetical protein
MSKAVQPPTVNLERAARQAAALRANLLRRKDQARLRKAAASGDEAVEAVLEQDVVEVKESGD